MTPTRTEAASTLPKTETVVVRAPVPALLTLIPPPVTATLLLIEIERENEGGRESSSSSTTVVALRSPLSLNHKSSRR